MACFAAEAAAVPPVRSGGMWTSRRPEAGLRTVPARRPGWKRLLGLPMTRVEGALVALAMLGWVVTGIAAHSGWIAWPTATLSAAACSLPQAAYRLAFDDDEDD